jgi:NTE family protein
MDDQPSPGSALPPPVDQEPGRPLPRHALCLSGGGFRAALLHLGALRRLNELGVLVRLDTISCVSGGSIIGAHLAQVIHDRGRLDDVIPDSEWELQVAQPFRALTARNLRTDPLKQRLFRPWNWLRPSTAVKALAARYEAELTGLRLDQLPERPNFVFCAADLTFGANWVFENSRVGDYQAGYRRPAPPLLLARAVAASSCFPPVFDPMPLGFLGLKPNDLKGGDAAKASLHTPEQLARRDDLVRHLALNDGGNYDNLGLEPVWFKGSTSAPPPVILVSDGGATFDFAATRFFHQRLMRYPAVLGNQVTNLRRRWLFAAHAQGTVRATYWGVGSAPESYDETRAGGFQAEAGYPKGLAGDVIAEIRTDLDAFSLGEIAVLENHGYLLADAAIKRWLPDLATSGAELRIPHPEWMDEAKVRDALRTSSKRTLFGR